MKKAGVGLLLSPVLVGDHVYFWPSKGVPVCVELKTGKVAAEGDTRLGPCSLTYADGRLYLRNMTGTVALVEASPAGFQMKGTFDPPRPSREEPSGVFPVISDGRLYLRDMDVLLCYDITDKRK